MGNDALGDRMKEYERRETAEKFMPLLPIYARIDGRGFSKFTKGFDFPYDPRFRQAMIDTTKWLVSQTNARLGYTQSDEISLCWLAENYNSEVFFGGKKQKMVGLLAALATQRFNRFLYTHPDPFIQQMAERAPTFDARVFQFPNKHECANAFVWRERDATKNALSMAASSVYSHKDLLGKNSADKHQLLFEKGINFNDYPIEFKRGVYIRRQQLIKPTLVKGEMLDVVRTTVDVIDLPRLEQIDNRVDVVFDGVNPVLRDTLMKEGE